MAEYGGMTMGPTSRTFRWLPFLLLFACGVIVGWIGSHVFPAGPSKMSTQFLRLEDGDYPLIRQLLACNINETTPAPELAPLQEIIEDRIETLFAQKNVTRIGVYVRTLEDGAWTAVNADDLFVPGSLMKIVKLIALLNEADRDATVLERTVTIPLNLSATPQHISPTASAVRGQTYTVRELLEYAIVHSDNVASNALSSVIDPDILNQTLSDLEIPEYADFDEAGTYTISPRLYSRFFRVLYNSTLLSPEYSELALEWLKESEYKDALAQGITDPTVVVAHKFGETVTLTSEASSVYQHHDCGIVYRESPYALCVMTEGEDLETLAQSIADITHDVDTFMQHR